MTKKILIIKKMFHQFISSRSLAYSLAAVSVMAGTATVATMTAPSTQNYDIDSVIYLVYLDGVFLLMLAAVVGKRLLELWRHRHQGKAGSNLHVKLVGLFGFVAVTPAILVAIFSALYLNFGLQAWFSERVNTALMESEIVANSYLEEHQKNFRISLLSIANELNFRAPYLINNQEKFNQILTNQADLQSLSEAAVIDGSGYILGKMRFSLSGSRINSIPEKIFQQANKGMIVVLSTKNVDQVRALIKLNRFFDTYLIVEKFLDHRVNRYINRIQTAVNEYRKLEKERGNFQISFVAIFVVVALLLLLAAAWVGITLANNLANPISRLIKAAEGIGKGDLNVRVNVTEQLDEINTLSKVFNTMAEEIGSQRNGLIDANRQLDERRRFTETVLSGVSAGVIGLDKHANIHLSNRSASSLLITNLETKLSIPLSEVVPEMTNLLNEVILNQEKMKQADIEIFREGQNRILHVRITGETLKAETIGYVITFDDITDLLAAQRMATWSDIAQRIAHEIKNPLTPIQLSAERIKTKYLKQIKTDRDIFLTCTDTIVRQVKEIGCMVDEFSSFARMPEPSMQIEDLKDICQQAIFLEQIRNPNLTFKTNFPKRSILLNCDKQQVSRALINILKNAAESIKSKTNKQKDNTNNKTGKISLKITYKKDLAGNEKIFVAITDNGPGLPNDPSNRLTEPYVTKRVGGSGLGLAIVKKIVEEHSGELNLENHKNCGAIVTLIFNQKKLSQENRNNNVKINQLVESKNSVKTKLLAKMDIKIALDNNRN